MQFGIFSVGDVTTDPTTGRTPSEAERIESMTRIALKAEEVGLDVFATGEHHNPPFVPSQPHDPPGLHRRQDREAASLHVHDADHHQRPGEDRRGLRDAPAPLGRSRRPDDGSRQHRPGLPVVRQGHPRRHRAGHRELPPAAHACGASRSSPGRASSAPRCRATPRTPGAPRRHAAVRVARLDPQHRDRRAGGLLRRRVLPQPHLLEQGAHRADGAPVPPAVSSTTDTAPPTRRIVGLGGQVFIGTHRGRGQAPVPALLRQRPRLRPRPVAGGLLRR